MSINQQLTEKKDSIIKAWCAALVGSYPEETQRFITREKDQFANPIGQSINKNMSEIYKALIGEEAFDTVSSNLEEIIKIRAVQDFSPSDSLLFIFQLKSIIRSSLNFKSIGNSSIGELNSLDVRIDELALKAFDIYSMCRQKLYEIRVNEVQNQVGRLLKRANLTVEIPD